ncbi:MAG: hypothetical protein WCF65_08830 [Parachlamydiaceae bacterium]
MNPIDSGQEQGEEIFRSLVGAGRGKEIEKKIRDLKTNDKRLLLVLKNWIDDVNLNNPEFFKSSYIFSKVLRKLSEATDSRGGRVMRAIGGIFRSTVPRRDREIERVLLGDLGTLKSYIGNYALSDNVREELLSKLLPHIEMESINIKNLKYLLWVCISGKNWNLENTYFTQAIPCFERLAKKNPEKFVEIFSLILKNGKSAEFNNKIENKNDFDKLKVPFEFLRDIAKSSPDSVVKFLGKILNNGDSQRDPHLACGIPVLEILAKEHPKKLAPLLTPDLMESLVSAFLEPSLWNHPDYNGKSDVSDRRINIWDEDKKKDILPVLSVAWESGAQADALVPLLNDYPIESLPILAQLAKDTSQHGFVKEFLATIDPTAPGKTFLDQHPVECLPVLKQLASEADYADFVMEFLSKEGSATQDTGTLLDRVPIECLPLLEELAKGDVKCQNFVVKFLYKKNVDGKTFLEQHFIKYLPVLKQLAGKNGLTNDDLLFIIEKVGLNVEKKIPLINVLINHTYYEEWLVKFFAKENSTTWQKHSSLRPTENIVPILNFLAERAGSHQFVMGFLSQPRSSNEMSFLTQHPIASIPLLTKLAAGTVCQEQAKLLLEQVLIESSRFEKRFARTISSICVSLPREGMKLIPKFYIMELAKLLEPGVPLLVTFINEEGLDYGGLSKDFLNGIFESFCSSASCCSSTGVSDAPLKLPITQSEDGKPSDEEMEVYRAIGKIIGYCYQSKPVSGSKFIERYSIGLHFDPCLFGSILSLSYEAIGKPFARLTSAGKIKMINGILTDEDAVLKKAMNVLNNINPGGLSDQDITDAALTALNLVNYPLDGSEPDQKLQKNAGKYSDGTANINTDKINLARKDWNGFRSFLQQAILVGRKDLDRRLVPAHAIAQGIAEGITQNSNKESCWLSLMRVSPDDFSLEVQGTVDRAVLIRSIEISTDVKENVATIEQKMGWLKKWLEQAPEKDLAIFLKFATASSGLRKDTKIKIQRQASCFSVFPIAHTCGPFLDLAPEDSEFIVSTNPLTILKDDTEENYKEMLKYMMSNPEIWQGFSMA